MATKPKEKQTNPSEVILEGDRIILRTPRMSDVDDIVDGVQHPDIPRFTFVPKPYHRQDGVDFVRLCRKWLREKSAYAFGIIEKESGKYIGGIGLHGVSAKHKRGEFGYWMNVKYRGRGYVKEAVAMILKFGFNDLKFARMTAHCMSTNTISEKIIRGAGLKYEGTLRKHIKHHGRWKDMKVFGILAEEYRALKKK